MPIKKHTLKDSGQQKRGPSHNPESRPRRKEIKPGGSRRLQYGLGERPQSSSLD